MYAIVDIAGMQFKIRKGDRIRVPRRNLDIGETTQLTNLLLWSKEDGISIGQPVLSDVAVNAKVLAHGRDEKVIVFKMKRRKGYHRKRGHRQDFTELLIEDFVRPGQIPEVLTEVVPQEEGAATSELPESEEEQPVTEELEEADEIAAEAPVLGMTTQTEEAQEEEQPVTEELEEAEEVTAEEPASETEAQAEESQEAEAALSEDKDASGTEPAAEGKKNGGE